MAAKKKTKKAASGRGVVKTKKGKRGAKSVVVTVPKPKKKKKKPTTKAKPVAPPKSGRAVPKINDPEGKPSVVLEPPPDK